MAASTAIGIVVCCVFIAMGATLEGTNLMAVFNVPAICVVVGGTLGVTIASSGMEKVKLIPKLYQRAFKATPVDYKARVDEIVELAERARKEGLLALDEVTGEIDDEFTRKGLQLVVDGTDPELVREILESEVEAMQARHHSNKQVFVQAGGFAPTLGVLGTVLSLVHVLENLDKPETLGHSIAGAFIATLLGVGTANVIYLPVANRLGELSKEEIALRYLTVEGILAIQGGENPRIVREKLLAFVPPSERGDAEDGGGSGAGGAVEPGRDQRMAA
jgi:chemotaxis protein MotA